MNGEMFVSTDVENMFIALDAAVGYGEIVSSAFEDKVIVCLVFRFFDANDEQKEILVPVQSSLGVAMLEGHWSILCRKRVDYGLEGE